MQEVSKNSTDPKVEHFKLTDVNLNCGYKIRREHVRSKHFVF